MSLRMSRRIVVCASGSSLGVIYPYLVLGRELKSQGNDVTICTEQRYSSNVARFGLRFHKVSGDPFGHMISESNQIHLRNGNQLKHFLSGQYLISSTVLREIQAACENADVIISSQGHLEAAYSMAEKLQVAIVVMVLEKIVYVPGKYPLILKPLQLVEGGIWNTVFCFGWIDIRKVVNQWRVSELGLHPIKSLTGIEPMIYKKKLPVLVPRHECVSEYITDQVPKAWMVSGALLDSSLPVSVEVQSFVEQSKENLVYFGMSKMPLPDARELFTLVFQFAKHTATRVVLCTGDVHLQKVSQLLRKSENVLLPGVSDQEGLSVPQNIFVTDYVPHYYLFPRCAVVIHHGGLGTTSAAINAGVPMVSCPVFSSCELEYFDYLQFGPKSIPFSRLTLNNLIGAYQEALDPKYKTNIKNYIAQNTLTIESSLELATQFVLSAPNVFKHKKNLKSKTQ